MDLYNLTDKFFQFIESNSNLDTVGARLSLKAEDYEFNLELALIQIEARKKATNKLKSFIANKKFIFPDILSEEQASHQAVAKYHAALIGDCKSIVDLTAGLGIDSLSFAMTSDFLSVLSVELSPEKCDALLYNSKVLNLKNLNVINSEAIDFLKSSKQNFDLIFVDPSRRGESNKRLYNLRDCSPDILSNQDLLLKKSNRVLIKASPLLDISQTLKDFTNVKNISIIGVKGECKEILIEIADKEEGELKELSAINLDNDGKILNKYSLKITGNELPPAKEINYAEISEIKEGFYLLEPSAMMMKLACWSSLGEKFKAKKIGKSSHLFISTEKPENFPGRVTLIQKVLKKQDRKSLSGLPSSVVSRNYPLTSDEIRKQLKLKEGDNYFIYATRFKDKPIMILTQSESESISG